MDAFLSLCCEDPPPPNAGLAIIPASKYAGVYRFTYNNQTYFHKTFHARNWLESVKNHIRSTRAARSLAGHELLSRYGFFTPEVVAIGHAKHRNFAVTTAVPDAFSAYAFLESCANGDDVISPHHKKHMIRKLGSIVGKMHSLRIVHGDLLCGNILLSETSRAGDYECYFIDNERTRRYPFLPAKLRLKNLVQLNKVSGHLATKTDRMLFFKHYIRHNPEIARRKNQWVNKIRRETNRRLAKK